MAYFNQNNQNNTQAQGMNSPEDEEEKKQQDGQQPMQLTSQSSTVTGSGPQGAAPTQTKQTSTAAPASGMGGGFQSYMKANQGAAQQKLNQTAQQNVQNKANAAQTGINQATNAFGKKVDAGSLANRYQAVQDVANVTQAARNLSSSAPAGQASENAQKIMTAAPTQFASMTPTAGATELNDDLKNRFTEVINARYKGPESLRQSGLYDNAAQRVNTAQTTLDQSKTATGREDMLRNMYQARGDYNRGLNKLDAALLNNSQEGVQALKNTAQAAGNVQDKLNKAQIGSTLTAQNRAQEINSIKEQAKGTFSAGKTAEEQATEDRITEMSSKPVLDADGKPVMKTDGTPMTEWDRLPEYFKGILSNSAGKPVDLNSFEAGVLGVNAGEGLYNMGANAIRTTGAERDRLITKDEQYRQAALAQLAGLDQANTLDRNLKYADADKAGTQSALDAIDLAGTRNALNESEKNFRDQANATDITGKGSKKVSRGNAFGKKTKTYHASVQGNVADMLDSAGYDMDAEVGAGQDTTRQEDLLKTALSRTNTTRNNADREDAEKYISSQLQGGATGASIGATFGGAPGAIIGGAAGVVAGGAIGSGTTDQLQQYTDLARGFGGAGEAIGKGIQDGRREVGKAAETLLGGDNFLAKGVGGIIGGIDSGAMKKLGDSVAKENAVADFQKKYGDYLGEQGFDNRFAIKDNEATTNRMTALQQILAKMDRSNT